MCVGAKRTRDKDARGRRLWFLAVKSGRPDHSKLRFPFSNSQADPSFDLELLTCLSCRVVRHLGSNCNHFPPADLPGLIQKPIISADQRRNKPQQMKGFEFGPSVASRLSSSRGPQPSNPAFNISSPGSWGVLGAMETYRAILRAKQTRSGALSSCGLPSAGRKRKKNMMRFAKIEKIAARVAMRALALVSLLSMAASTRAQDATRPYPKMLPLSQYLMDRDAAIALARSAAPEGISKDASVLVLTPKGWETAVQGTNGFVCMAGPAWTAAIDFYDVWSPKQRGAICLNPAAVRSILPIFRKLTQMTLAGVTSVKERIAGIQEAYAKKEIPAVEPGAMSYMMSKNAYLSHLGSHNLCHVMFFLPIKDPAELNADDPNAPISSTSIWFPDPDKPDSPLNKELPPLRTAQSKCPIGPMALLRSTK